VTSYLAQLRLVRWRNLLSAPESGRTDGRISCRHSANASFVGSRLHDCTCMIVQYWTRRCRDGVSDASGGRSRRRAVRHWQSRVSQHRFCKVSQLADCCTSSAPHTSGQVRSTREWLVRRQSTHWRNLHQLSVVLLSFREVLLISSPHIRMPYIMCC